MSPRIDTLAVPVVPSTSSTAPVMADTTAIVGTATNMPVRPPIVNPIRRARRITAGCSSRVRSGQVPTPIVASRRPSGRSTISSSNSAVGSPAERETGEHQDPCHEEAADVRDEPGSQHEHRKWPRERHADQGQDDEARAPHPRTRSRRFRARSRPLGASPPRRHPGSGRVASRQALRVRHPRPCRRQGADRRSGRARASRWSRPRQESRRSPRPVGTASPRSAGPPSFSVAAASAGTFAEASSALNRSRPTWRYCVRSTRKGISARRSTGARRPRSGPRRRSIRRRPSHRPSRALEVAR